VQTAERLDRLLRWCQDQDYAGYSKFDAFNSPFVRLVTPDSKKLRAVVAAAWARSPISIRPLVATAKSRNPKGIALFSLAYLRRFQADDQPFDLAEARRLLAWLEENSTPGFSGRCWGYDHAWYGLHFFSPRYFPNVVVTGNIAHAYLEAFEITGDDRYLEVARSTVDFFLRDLGKSVDTPRMRNIGYIPGNTWGVLNINGLVASILVRVTNHTGERSLTREARRLMTFLVDKQTDYGAWHYAWPARSSLVKHDNYHTGNVLDWILEFSVRSGDDSFMESYRRGLEYYRDNLFGNDGFPKWRSDTYFPADVHGAAQGIVTFAKAALEFDDRFIECSRSVARWALTNMQHRDGWFFFQKGRFVTKRYTLMRWCNSWMAYALASLLSAESRLAAREKGAGVDQISSQDWRR